MLRDQKPTTVNSVTDTLQIIPQLFDNRNAFGLLDRGEVLSNYDGLRRLHNDASVSLYIQTRLSNLNFLNSSLLTAFLPYTWFGVASRVKNFCPANRTPLP
jgi:hypothetical protein